MEEGDGMSGGRGNCSWDAMYERIILKITFHRGCLRLSENRYLHYDS